METAAHETGNVVPLLHEVRQAIQRQIESGEDTVIDLRSLPMAPGEEARIEEMLGRGEMEVRLINALGLTEIHETSFSGVWWVAHHNQNDAVISKYIQIARVPSMFNSQTVDMKAAIDVMDQAPSASDH